MIKNLFFKAPRSTGFPYYSQNVCLGSNLALARTIRPNLANAYCVNPCQVMPSLACAPFATTGYPPIQCRPFSQYFRDLDEAALKEFSLSYCGSKAYTKAVNLWKVPLEKKRLRRERKAANPPRVEPPEASGLGLAVVHEPERGITWPPTPDQCFAVINVKGQ